MATQEIVQNNLNSNENLNKEQDAYFTNSDVKRQYKKQRTHNHPYNKKVVKIQSVFRGFELRKNLSKKIAIFIFGKAFSSYVRRYKRKVLKKDAFRLIRNLYALQYNCGQNLEKIKVIQIHLKNRFKRRRIRKEIMLNLLVKLFNRNKSSTFKNIRMAKLSDDKEKEYFDSFRHRYTENLLSSLKIATTKSSFKHLINVFKHLIEKKKNNFVYNYFLNSFAKNLKFYISKWRRISRKMVHDDFFLNQNEDDDVIDKEEERRRIENNKAQNLIIKKFRIIANRKLKSNFDKIKERFISWKEKTLLMKVNFYREKIRNQIEKEKQEKNAFVGKIESDFTTFNISDTDFEKIKEKVERFTQRSLEIGSNQSNLNNEAVILEIARRFGEWKHLKDKDIDIALIPRENIYSHFQSPLNFTIELDQIHYRQGFKHNQHYQLGQLIKKNLETGKKSLRFLLRKWQLNAIQSQINTSFGDITKVMRNAIESKVVEEEKISLIFKKSENTEKSRKFPLLQIQDRMDLIKDKNVKHEDIDDYYEINYIYEFGRKMKDFEEKKQKYITKAYKSRSFRGSNKRFLNNETLIGVGEHEEYIDNEKEDLENEFLKIYKKSLEKATPNDEDDHDDETRRYLVNFDDYEEDEEEKFLDNFEERMKKKKRDIETIIEFVQEEDLNLNYGIFDIETLREIREITKKNRLLNKQKFEDEKTEENLKISCSNVDENYDSDNSIDELRNFKKNNSSVVNNEGFGLLKRGTSHINADLKINLKPRYIDVYSGGEKYFVAKKEKKLKIPAPKQGLTRMSSTFNTNI